jgi:hypothetical protein
MIHATIIAHMIMTNDKLLGKALILI